MNVDAALLQKHIINMKCQDKKAQIPLEYHNSGPYKQFPFLWKTAWENSSFLWFIKSLEWHEGELMMTVFSFWVSYSFKLNSKKKFVYYSDLGQMKAWLNVSLTHTHTHRDWGYSSEIGVTSSVWEAAVFVNRTIRTFTKKHGYYNM